MKQQGYAIRRTHVIHDFDMSYEEIKKGWKMPYAHHHAHYEIYILLSGERIVTIGDTHYPIKAGQATLFPSEVLHRSSGESDFSGICIHFSIRLLTQHFKQRTVNELMRCFNQPVINVPPTALDGLLAQTKNHVWYASDNYLKLAQLLYDFNTYQHEAPYKPQAVADTADANAAANILDYISANYIRIRTISDIIDALGVSEAYIYKVLRTQKSMTPKEYINRLRIHHACRELEYSDKTIAYIAEASGFQSAAYFIRTFKKYMGMTPSAYREGHAAP